MLNGPTYPHLVKDFWVRAEAYDEFIIFVEENQKVVEDNSLRGKNRKEMGLKEFKEMEIRFVVMGVSVTITQKIIAKLLGVSTMGMCTLNTKESHPEAEVIKTKLFGNSDDFGKVKNMNTPYKLPFKILSGCLIPKEGSIDQIS